MNAPTYELIILGGGPAGTAAGVYAARKHLSTVLITQEFGGQSVVSPDIQNWIGTPHISGVDLAKSFEEHLREYAGSFLTILKGKTAVRIEDDGTVIRVVLDSGKTIEGKTLLYALGASRRKLPAKGADKFEHKGLTYCASCDGPLFAAKDVAVIGGGNAGFETAAQLAAYTTSVLLLEYGDAFRADPVTVEKVLANPKVRAHTNAEVIEVFGASVVEGIRWKEQTTGKERTETVAGVFVEIGLIPNTQLVADIVKRDERGAIEVDPWTGKTSHPRVWAAGDCTNVRYHQNNIAAGDGVKALEDIYLALRAS